MMLAALLIASQVATATASPPLHGVARRLYGALEQCERERNDCRIDLRSERSKSARPGRAESSADLTAPAAPPAGPTGIGAWTVAVVAVAAVALGAAGGWLAHGL